MKLKSTNAKTRLNTQKQGAAEGQPDKKPMRQIHLKLPNRSKCKADRFQKREGVVNPRRSDFGITANAVSLIY